MGYVKEEELGKLYKFDELKNLGVKTGDIVAHKSLKFDEGYSWEYVLLRNGFPEEFNTALCCYKDPRYPDRTFLTQIGFHWCGSTDSFDFRLINEKEKDDFVSACIDRLKIPYRYDYSLWRTISTGPSQVLKMVSKTAYPVVVKTNPLVRPPNWDGS